MSIDQLLLLPPGYGFDATNAAPTITVPGAQSAVSNVAIAITGTSIADADSNPQTLTITTNQAGTISLATTTGLTGSGNGTNSLSYSGTLAAINTAIATLTYTTALDYAGAETITIGTNDGAGGTDSKTIAVTATFTPLSLGSGLSFWVRPDAGLFEDAGTDPAEQADPVYQQNDYSSGGRNSSQVTLGKRPVLSTVSSQPMLTYVAASSQELALSSDLTVGANSAGWCIYCVCSRSSNAQNVIPLGNSPDDRAVMLFGTTAYLLVGAFITAAGVTGSGLMLLKWSRVAAPSGGLVTFQATGYAATSMGWSGTDVGTFKVNRIGVRAAASQYTNGSLSHIVVTNTDISGTDKETKLLAWIAAQTGAAL